MSTIVTITAPNVAEPPASRPPIRSSEDGGGDYELQLIVHSRRTQHQQRQQVRIGSDTQEDGSASRQTQHGTGGDNTDAEVPPTPYPKLLSCAFSFFFSGVNDGTLGTLVPYIQDTFAIGTGEIAIIYATSFTGWLLAAALNPFLTPSSTRTAHPFTLGRVLLAGALLQTTAQALRSAQPAPRLPLPLYALSFLVQALGMALQDAHSNTFVSIGAGVRRAGAAHRWLGFVHAAYAGGTLLGPPVATAIASRGGGGGDGGALGGDWLRVYLVLLGLGVANTAGVAAAFGDTIWRRGVAGGGFVRAGDDTAAAAVETTTTTGRRSVAARDMRDLFGLRSFWWLCIFYFFYLGAAITAGGWVVEYLVKVRGGDLSTVGYAPTGFNGGMLLGRVALVEPTFRLGEKRMVLVYAVVCVGFQLVFWLVPNIVAGATAMSIMGFLLGPWFATGVSVGSKLFPRKVRASGLSFVFVIAQAGGALFPSLTGVIATSAGVQVLQPITLALLVASGFSWWMVPKALDRSDTTNA